MASTRISTHKKIGIIFQTVTPVTLSKSCPLNQLEVEFIYGGVVRDKKIIVTASGNNGESFSREATLNNSGVHVLNFPTNQGHWLVTQLKIRLADTNNRRYTISEINVNSFSEDEVSENHKKRIWTFAKSMNYTDLLKDCRVDYSVNKIEHSGEIASVSVTVTKIRAFDLCNSFTKKLNSKNKMRLGEFQESNTGYLIVTFF